MVQSIRQYEILDKETLENQPDHMDNITSSLIDGKVKRDKQN